jgi:transcriptional regulator with XRE-family HTH domain
MSRRLHNYVRTYRRRLGFSQAELAMLLGASSEGNVSRYEHFARTPSLEAILGLEIVLDEAAKELFAGRHHAVEVAVRARARRLLTILTERTPGPHPPRLARKIERLRAIVEGKPCRVTPCG